MPAEAGKAAPVKRADATSAHVIVLANEKGGTGKSTIAGHIAVALLKSGQRVATIDLDPTKRTLTHFVADRRAWARHRGIELEIPDHICIAEAKGARRDLDEDTDRDTLIRGVSAVEHDHDFLVIDTPPADSYLMWLALGMADTLVMPLNDSFVDFDALGVVDPVGYGLIEPSAYTRMICDERHARRKFKHDDIDWIALRNRFANASPSRPDRVAKALDELALHVGFRWLDGLSERAIYREFMPHGLTVLDEIGDGPLGERHKRSLEGARQEMQSLMDTLNLPINEKGRQHWAARAEWFATRDKRLKLDEVVNGA
ncbi:MAG: division plane positioning ATPase MipZ [Pseudolabrys sp.]